MRLKLVCEGDVEVTRILVVGAVGENTGHRLFLLNGQDITEVEHGLLPVGVLRVGAGGEGDGLVASAELDIKPSDHSVNKVAALDRERVGDLKRKVLLGNSVEVESDDGARVSDKSLELNGVDERLGKGDFLHRAVVESVDVVPD